MASSKRKGFVNPLDALGVEPEDLDTAAAPPPAVQPRRRSRASRPAAASTSKRFDSPTDQLSRRDVNRAATNKVMAGQYQRKTITLPPEQVEFIGQLAAKEGIGVLEFYRWLVDTALMVYEDGFRPEIRAREVRSETRKGHWSSQAE